MADSQRLSVIGYCMLVIGSSPSPRIANQGALNIYFLVFGFLLFERNWRLTDDQFPIQTPGSSTIVAVEVTTPPGANVVQERLVSVDLQTGATMDLGFGRDPTTGPEGELAYCDKGGRFVVTNVDRPEAVEIVADVRNFTSCVTSAWNSKGDLAFLARIPFGSRSQTDPIALVIRDIGGQLRYIALPENIRGYSPLSWSADDAKVARVFRENEIPAPIVFDHARILREYFIFKKTGRRPKP